MFGAVLLISLYLYLFWNFIHVAKKSIDVFGSVLVVGCLIHLSCQTLINIAVNVSMIPNTGIGLPFVSYGGTAVFCQLIEIAIILFVERVGNGYRNIDLTRIIKNRNTSNGKNHMS